MIHPGLLARQPQPPRQFRALPALNYGGGQVAANNAAALVGVGGYYVGGLATPQAWDDWDFNSTTDLSQIPDSTGAVQNAINAAAATASGGVVYLPPGVIRVNGVTISQGGVTLRGAGYEECNGAVGAFSPAQRGRRGTYILTDSVAAPAISVQTSASSVRIEDIAFIQTMVLGPFGGGPTPFLPCIAVSGPGSGAVLLQRLLFWGCNDGISIGYNSQVTSRVTIRDVVLATLGAGLLAYKTDNQFTADNVSMSPDLLTGTTGWTNWIATNGKPFYFRGCADSMVSNIRARNCGFGFVIEGGGAFLPTVPSCYLLGTNIAFQNLNTDAVTFSGGANRVRFANVSSTGLHNPDFFPRSLGDNIVSLLNDTSWGWASFIPATLTADAGTFTLASAQGSWRLTGNTCEFQIQVTITTAGTATGAVHVALPVNITYPAAAPTNYTFVGTEQVSKKSLAVLTENPASTIRITMYDGTSPIANGNVLQINGSYPLF